MRRATTEMLSLRRQLFVEWGGLQPLRAVANFSIFCLLYQGKNRRVLPALGRGLPRVLVEPLIQPPQTLSPRTQMQRPHAPAKQPGTVYPPGRTLKSVIESYNAGKRLASRILKPLLKSLHAI